MTTTIYTWFFIVLLVTAIPAWVILLGILTAIIILLIVDKVEASKLAKEEKNRCPEKLEGTSNE